MEELSVLVERAAAGDLQAFGEIVARFQDMAYGYSYALLGDAHLAQDAAQEAFLEAYRSLQKLSEPAAFPGWLKRIVLGKCGRLMRERKLPEAPLEAAAGMASRAPSPAENVLSGELKQAVLDAIRSLPEGERAVTTLFYIDGYSQQEIAGFLEVPLTTVKNRLYRSRRRLKERMTSMVKDTLWSQRPSRNEEFKESVMKIIAANEREHLSGLAELFYTDAASHFRERREAEDGRVAHSHYDWDATRVGVVNGEVAAVWSVYDILMRIGTARVRTAGHNFCKILPKYAGQGWLEKTAEACLASLPDHGYDLAVHQGDFEEIDGDLGFSPGWREHHWSVRVEDLPEETFDGELHEFEGLADLPELAELYNHDNACVTGTAVRPTFRKSKHPNCGPSYYWTDQNGKPVGYVFGGYPRGECSRIGVEESAGDPRVCLAVLRRLADERKAEWVWFIRLPYQSRMGRYLRSLDRRPRFCANPRGMRMKICQGTDEGTRPGSMRYMVRILNLASLFEKLCGELGNRLQKSCFCDFVGELAIGYGNEQIILALDRGNVTVAAGKAPPKHAIRGVHGIVQLVVGTEEPDDILVTSDIEVSGKGADLASALFPKQYPQMPNQAL